MRKHLSISAFTGKCPEIQASNTWQNSNPFFKNLHGLNLPVLKILIIILPFPIPFIGCEGILGMCGIVEAAASAGAGIRMWQHTAIHCHHHHQHCHQHQHHFDRDIIIITITTTCLTGPAQKTQSNPRDLLHAIRFSDIHGHWTSRGQE